MMAQALKGGVEGISKNSFEKVIFNGKEYDIYIIAFAGNTMRVIPNISLAIKKGEHFIIKKTGQEFVVT